MHTSCFLAASVLRYENFAIQRGDKENHTVGIPPSKATTSYVLARQLSDRKHWLHHWTAEFQLYDVAGGCWQLFVRHGGCTRTNCLLIRCKTRERNEKEQRKERGAGAQEGCTGREERKRAENKNEQSKGVEERSGRREQQKEGEEGRRRSEQGTKAE